MKQSGHISARKPAVAPVANLRGEDRTVPIDTLHEDPANVRRHGERNRAVVRASLQEFGQVERLVVEKGTGRVLGGNCRLAELRALGRETVDVREVDIHGVDAARLALALNRSAELAEWDDDGLADLLRGLQDDDADLDALGWDDGELEGLLGDVAVVDDPDDDYGQGMSPSRIFNDKSHGTLCVGTFMSKATIAKVREAAQLLSTVQQGDDDVDLGDRICDLLIGAFGGD